MKWTVAHPNNKYAVIEADKLKLVPGGMALTKNTGEVVAFFNSSAIRYIKPKTNGTQQRPGETDSGSTPD